MFPKNNIPNGLRVLVLLSLALLVIAACAPVAAPPAAQPTSAPAAQPTAAPAEPTAAPAEPTAAPAEPTAAASGADYDAAIRPATKRWKIGYGDGLAGTTMAAAMARRFSMTSPHGSSQFSI